MAHDRTIRRVLVLAYVFVAGVTVAFVMLWSWAVRDYTARGNSFAGLLVIGIPIAFAAGLWGGIARLRRLQAERRNSQGSKA